MLVLFKLWGLEVELGEVVAAVRGGGELFFGLLIFVEQGTHVIRLKEGQLLPAQQEGEEKR